MYNAFIKAIPQLYQYCKFHPLPNTSHASSLLSTRTRSCVVSCRRLSRLLPPCSSDSLGVLLVGHVGEGSLRGIDSRDLTALTSKTLLAVLIDERVAEDEEQDKLQAVRDEERADTQLVLGRLVGLVEERASDVSCGGQCLIRRIKQRIDGRGEGRRWRNRLSANLNCPVSLHHFLGILTSSFTSTACLWPRHENPGLPKQAPNQIIPLTWDALATKGMWTSKCWDSERRKEGKNKIK